MQAKHNRPNRFDEINNYLTHITYEPFNTFTIQSFSIGWRLNTISKIINEKNFIQTKSIRFDFTKHRRQNDFKEKNGNLTTNDTIVRLEVPSSPT